VAVHLLSASYARGELSPRLHGRADIEAYAMSLAEAKNWIVSRQGGLIRRPGFVHVHPLRAQSQKGRLVEFEFNEEQAYAILFNAGTIRFFTAGGIVTRAAQNITGITKANPAVVTYSGSDTYANDDFVVIDGVAGMTEVNGREFKVANVNTGSNTFELHDIVAGGIDSSSYGTYTGGGTVSEIYEILSPYSESDLFDLQFAQAGDTVYIAHPSYAPRKLVRTSETSWAISTIEFLDGPYLDEDTEGTTLTPASTGAVHPIMSGLTAPSGTAANDEGDADAWEVFDADKKTRVTWTGEDGWISYDLPSTNTKICDAYWLLASPDAAAWDDMFTAWTFEGYDGSNWVVLDTRQNETGWTASEYRYYEFPNQTAYQSYRIQFTGGGGDDGSSTDFCGTGWHEEGDSQTAFNLTASAVTGINDGQGFLTTDVGRTIRLMGSDGRWRWARIAARTSTTVVTIRLYGHSLPDLNPITRWRMSAFSVDTGFPACVGFFEDRLVWGSTSTEPRKLWASVVADYENHAVSQPSGQATDAINAQMTGGSLSKIVWLEEMADLLVGTADAADSTQPLVMSSGAVRVVGPGDPGEPFSNTNIRQKRQATALMFADRYGKRIFETVFDFAVNGYTPSELSILSDHLFTSGVVEAAFQQYPHNIAWFPTVNGRAVALTRERAQQIAGMTPIVVTGGDADTDDEAEIESIASIPSSGGDVVYAVIKRTIGGATQRSVEYLAPFYEEGDDLEDAVYLDGALTYDGSATSTITGAWHLRGETVGVFADGVDIGDATVSSTGSLTLPGGLTGSVVTIGRRYTSRAKTLRLPQSGNRDGSALGRKMIVAGPPAVDLLNSKGLMIGGASTTTRPLPRAQEDADDGELNTGMFEAKIDDRWQDNGVLVMETNKAYPVTIRAVRVPVEGEP
jgi:hypothetical protein